MKLNKILLTASLLLAGVCANAQETVTEYVFKPHWYGQLQFGFQETVGEGKFGKLMSPNAQIAIGYKFNPYIGIRGAINGWQSRGAFQVDGNNLVNGMGLVPFNDGKNNYYHWAYLAGTVDAVVDLTNLIGGYNPTRLVQVDLIAGLGVNGRWHNSRAIALNNAIKEYEGVDFNPLQNIWDHSHAAFLGQFGLDLNFNCSDRFQVGLELMANTLTDKYNSKKAANTDWYFNCLVGIKYAFGPKYETVTRVIEPAVVEPQIIERIVEKVVEVPAQPAPAPCPEPMRRDVFFKINTYNITATEMTKVAEIAQYLKEHPEANVTITGYADKGTGTMAINLRLSAQRAQAVANALQKDYGIAASRMVVKSMGESEYQPYPDAVQNRVAICIAE